MSGMLLSDKKNPKVFNGVQCNVCACVYVSSVCIYDLEQIIPVNFCLFFFDVNYIVYASSPPMTLNTHIRKQTYIRRLSFKFQYLRRWLSKSVWQQSEEERKSNMKTTQHNTSFSPCFLVGGEFASFHQYYLFIIMKVKKIAYFSFCWILKTWRRKKNRYGSSWDFVAGLFCLRLFQFLHRIYCF